MKGIHKLWIWLGVLIVLSPLGLYLPAKFGAGSAWGEWSGEELKQLVGYVPAGLGKMENLWHAPLPDYAVRGQANSSLPALSLSYILSAAVGVAVVVVLAMLIGKVLAKKETDSAP